MATVNSARPGTKRFTAIEIMNANATLPMTEVLALLVAGVPLRDTGEARAYYKHLLETKLAEGTGVTELPKVAKEPKATKAEKPAKEPKPSKAERQSKMQKALGGRTDAELDAIKAKNAAKMAAIAAARGNKLSDFEPRVSAQEKADIQAEMNADLQGTPGVIVPGTVPEFLKSADASFLNQEQTVAAVSVS